MQAVPVLVLVSNDFICVLQGRVVSFRHSLIIMTSNVGSAAISGSAGAVGFQLSAGDGAEADADTAYSRIKERVTDELKVRRLGCFAADAILPACHTCQ